MKNRIRELRKKNDLTLKQLGRKVGVAESTMSLYENFKRQPDISTLARIADVFGVSIDYILLRSDDPRQYDSPATEEDIRLVAGMIAHQSKVLLKAADPSSDGGATLSVGADGGIYCKGLPPEAVEELKNFSKYVFSKYNK